jgi:hypothetical protein
MYRDDDVARGERANALISEIGDLERQKVEAAKTEARLAAARDELRGLQAASTVDVGPAPERPASVTTHIAVFAMTAGAAYGLYALVLAG